MHIITKSISILGVVLALSSSALANDAMNENERKFYVGGAFGYSGSLKPRFTDAETKGVFSIKKSHIYNGLVGYHVTPDIMVELSAEYKPTYRFGIRLPATAGGDYETTKAQSRVFMLNFVYNLKELQNIQPYFTVGVGLAQVQVKKVGIEVDLNAATAKAQNIPVAAFIAGTGGGYPQSYKFNTTKHTANCFAWQVGLGVSKALTESFSLELLGRLQVAHNVSIRYTSLDKKATAAAAQRGVFKPVYNAGKVKKTLGVGEITAGFTYKLPI